MALGEAFVNVRANLKPFANDLEKGIKAILADAEKRARDSNIGKTLGDDIEKKVGAGVENGLSDGSKRGRRKAEREAMGLAQRIFAIIGDFADDGLSAVPAEVKAAIVVGVLAAAPLVSGALAAAVGAGVGALVVGLATVVAAQAPRVKEAFSALGTFVLADLVRDAEPLFEPLEKAALRFRSAFLGLGKEIRTLFAEAAADVEPFTDAIIAATNVLIPNLRVSLQQSRPIIKSLDTDFAILADSIGRSLVLLTDESDRTAQSLTDLVVVLGTSIQSTAVLIRTLSELSFWLRGLPLALYSDSVAKSAEETANAAGATSDLVYTQQQLEAALHGATSAAIAEKLAIGGIISEMLSGLDASIRYEEAIDNLAESFKKGNRSLDEGNEKGRANLRLVEQAIAAAARQRDDAIANAAQTGQSLDEIDAKYQRQIDKIVATTGKVGQQDKAFKDLIARVRQVPTDVEIKITAPNAGHVNSLLGNLISNAKALGAEIKAALDKANQNKNNKPKPNAMGSINTSPTVALVAEAGYSEAIIPDPAVMPGRALELSNKFGLTDLIAQSLGAQTQVTNVYIGSERLRQMIDYQVHYNNTQLATSMAQGTRSF